MVRKATDAKFPSAQLTMREATAQALSQISLRPTACLRGPPYCWIFHAGFKSYKVDVWIETSRCPLYNLREHSLDRGSLTCSGGEKKRVGSWSACGEKLERPTPQASGSRDLFLLLNTLIVIVHLSHTRKNRYSLLLLFKNGPVLTRPFPLFSSVL